MTIDLYNLDGKIIKEISLPEKIFKAEINKTLMAQAVRVYLANQRQGTQSAKTRGEVTGSTRKIYRQKGTGNARHGDQYAPIFVGGGVAFPPKPRDFRLSLSKKMRRLALYSALSQKLKDKAIIVVDGLTKIKGKTKEMSKVLINLGLKEKKEHLLLVLPEKLEKLILASRNIEDMTLVSADLLTTYGVLDNDKIILLTETITKIDKLWN